MLNPSRDISVLAGVSRVFSALLRENLCFPGGRRIGAERAGVGWYPTAAR